MSTVSHIILGIGNRGEEYYGTRHNIGFNVVDALATAADSLKQKPLQHSFAAEATFGDSTVLLLKPTTYVNLSGVAAQEALSVYNLATEDMIVIVDDFHIDLGTLRFRRKGSAGGHNGLKSLIAECGSTFHRLRFGIGPKPRDSEIIDFVLGTFQESEMSTVEEATETAREAILLYINEGIAQAMNRYNS